MKKWKSKRASKKTYNFLKRQHFNQLILSKQKWHFTTKRTKRFSNKSCRISLTKSENYKKKYSKPHGWWIAKFQSQIRSRERLFRKWISCKVRWEDLDTNFRIQIKLGNKRCRLMRWA